jgi:hypothetical protein
MDSKVIAAVAGAIGLVFVIIAFRPVDVSNIPEHLVCSSDDDCIPEGECHPTSCINEDFIVRYSDMFCTTECAPGTMDCGQGSCICHDNECVVMWVE